MKTFKNVLLCLLATILFSNFSFAQEEAFKPVYLTITTTYWNDSPDADFSDWMETEKEFFDKVTSKNDMIIGSGYYLHYYTPNSNEVVIVNVYANWADIEGSNEVNAKLIEEAWPDEEERQAFLTKQAGYYSADHKDEIYVSTPWNIPMAEKSDKPLVYYVRQSNLAMDGQGSSKDFKEFFDNVIAKNDVIKAYHSHRHLWGSNAREFSEVFVVEELADLERSNDKINELVEAYWPDEEKRKEFFERFNKIFTTVHSDLLYRSVPELQK